MKLTRDSLAWFAVNWNTAICGSADAAQFLAIKPATLKTRIARNQAMAMRTPGEVRGSVEFTGFQLVYNLLQHSFMRHRLQLPGLETVDCPQIRQWCADVNRDVLHAPFLDDVVIRVLIPDEGNLIFHYFEDDVDLMASTREPAFIIPIGTMLKRIARELYRRKSDKSAIADMPDISNKE